MDYIEENDNQLENSPESEEVNADSVESVEDSVEIEEIQENACCTEEDFVPEKENIVSKEEKYSASDYISHKESPKRKGNMLVSVIAMVLILGIVVFGAIKIFSNKGIATVDSDIYEIGMKAVEFIENKKLLNADLVSAGGDLQTALGTDYLVIQNFDTVYTSAMASSADGVTPETDTQYFVQMIGVALSAQVQQLALDSIIDDVEANSESWAMIDTSGLPDVADAYQRIWQNTVKLIKAGNMDKIKSYYDNSEWISELEPVEEYIQYFDSQLSATDEYYDEYSDDYGDDYYGEY